MEHDQALSFGSALRDHRERAGLSQEELANRAGLTRNGISALERGERQRPYPHTVRALAAALALGPEEHERLVRLARGRAATPQEPTIDPRAIVASLAATRTPQPRPATLPTPPNALIGRRAERQAITEALAHPSCRLITISGPGGVGKTRMALQVAADLAAQFGDGVAWVPLAGIAAAEQVPAAIAEALNAPLQGSGSPHEQLLAALADRALLLVLDNAEHLAGIAALLAALLEQAAGVGLLVTSRERLRIAGEWVVNLGGLPLPAGTADGHSEAVELFVERARQRAHGLALCADDSALVARICRLVEGMPLGIELAAAWVATLSLAEIAQEITQNLDFLANNNRDAPDRHRSLRAVFDHSWRLLSAEEQQVFARLAIFRGGFSREAAASVAGASLPMLAALADKSLVRRTASGETTRYDLHELLRQYALAQLDAHGEAGQLVRDLHCAYYARHLGNRSEALQGPDASQALHELAPDLDNIRAAWAWAAERHHYQAFAQMGRAMYQFWLSRCLFEEGLALVRMAVTSLRAALQAPEPPSEARSAEFAWTLGQLLSQYGNWAMWCGRFGEAREHLHASYELLAHRNDLLAAGGTLFFLGYMNHLLGQYDEAEAWLTRSVDLSHAHGHSYFAALSGSVLALTMHARGSPAALDRARAALDDWRRNGQPSGWAFGLLRQSAILLDAGLLAEAEPALHEGLQLAVSVQDRWMVGLALLQLGRLAHTRGEAGAARTLVDESLRLLAALPTPHTYGRALVLRGWVAHAAGEVDAAHGWFEQALGLATATQLDPIRLDAQLGLATLAATQAHGAALAYLDQIVAHQSTSHQTRVRALQLQLSIQAQNTNTRHSPP